MKNQNGERFSFTKREIIPLIIFLFGIGSAWGINTYMTNVQAKDIKEVKVVNQQQNDDIVAMKGDIKNIKEDVNEFKMEQRVMKDDISQRFNEQTKLLWEIKGALKNDD